MTTMTYKRLMKLAHEGKLELNCDISRFGLVEVTYANGRRVWVQVEA